MPNRSLPLYVRVCKWLGLPPDRMLFLVSDMVCLVLSAVLALVVRTLLGNFYLSPQTLPAMALIFPCAPIVALGLGLYTSVLLQPPHQVLYRLFCFVSVVYGILYMSFFFAQTGILHSRLLLLLGWLISCLTVPLGRHFVARIFCHCSWWGFPIVFFSRTATDKKVWHYLRKNPQLGFRPVAFHSVPEQSEAKTAQELQELVTRFSGAVALVARRSDRDDRRFFSLVTATFSRVLIVPVDSASDAVRSFLVTPYVLDTTTGYYLQQRLHDKRRLAVKRALDLVLCLAGSLVAIPLGLVLALAIRLDSKGPVIIRQHCLGMGGRDIVVHKFRTRRVDPPAADTQPAHGQAGLPDPALTRMGLFLCRTRLDELPKLLDVVRGAMSLVGPRPIVEAERSRYGAVFAEYIRVRPGMTGLWQIDKDGDKLDDAYDRRVASDYYYVANWCVWLDIWILARSLPMFLRGKDISQI